MSADRSSGIHFVASPSEKAQAEWLALTDRYGQAPLEAADVIVALGGDGFMLRTLHRLLPHGLPIYGMKIGNVGFLMNRFRDDDLAEQIEAAERVALKPLRMVAHTESGNDVEALAINEISLIRQTNQAAHLRIIVNGEVKVEELVADGILLSTAAGSTAYNLSADGPILPLGTEALCLTPISPFRPRRWRGAVLPSSARVRFEVLDPYKRSVSATADAHEVRNVVAVDCEVANDQCFTLLFDADHSLEQRIIDEQFL